MKMKISDSLEEMLMPNYLMLLVLKGECEFWAAESQASPESGIIMDLLKFIV